MTAYLAEARWFAGKGRDVRRGRRRARRHPARTAGRHDRHHHRGVRRGGRWRADHRALPDAALALPRGAGPHRARLHRAARRRGPRRRAQLRRRARPRGDGGLPRHLRAARSAEQPESYGGVTFHRVAGYDLDTESHSSLFKRRAEQLLGRVRRRQPDEGVPQGDARAQPRHRDPPGADRGRQPPRGPPLRLDRGAGGRPGDAPAVPPHRQRRLGPRAGQRAQPVRRGRPARRRGGRRLRRRGTPARRRGERGPRGPARALRRPSRSTAPPPPRRCAAAWSPPPPPCRPWPTTREALEQVFARIGDATARRAWPSGCTATCTSARPCAPPRAGSWSTSRASRPSRWPSAGSPTPPGATSPACCAPSTTPPSRWSRTSTTPTSPGPQITYRANEWVDRNRAAFLDGLRRGPLRRGGGPLSADEQALIDAYEADKAVYEVLYEARNRPTWLDIPLGAIERIGA